jgi:uncharacterized membrane protein YfcA
VGDASEADRAASASPGVVWRRLTSPRGALLVPAAVTLVWAVVVVGSGELERVLSHWESSLTMAGGSFLGGASPGGGGAVAFPVFTKVLDITPPVARTFSLCIQAVGMTSAGIAIVLTGRTIEVRALLLSILGGTAGFLVAVLTLSDFDSLFWASRLPASYVKVTFTVVLAGMAMVMLTSWRRGEFGSQHLVLWTRRMTVGLLLAAFLGGVLASLVGTGVNVLVFLFIVLVFGLHPRVGVPTSVIAMAAISLVGLATLGVIDGQLAVSTNEAGEVVRVGGEDVAALGEEFDLLGLWLAAVPVAVWGAPFGAWVVHRLHEEWLVIFLAFLAIAEVVSTVVLLDDLRSDVWLVGYGLIGLIVAVVGVRWISVHREWLCGELPELVSDD